MLKLPLAAPFVGEQRNGAVGGDGLMGLAAAVLEVEAGTSRRRRTDIACTLAKP